MRLVAIIAVSLRVSRRTVSRFDVACVKVTFSRISFRLLQMARLGLVNLIL